VSNNLLKISTKISANVIQTTYRRYFYDFEHVFAHWERYLAEFEQSLFSFPLTMLFCVIYCGLTLSKANVLDLDFFCNSRQKPSQSQQYNASQA